MDSQPAPFIWIHLAPFIRGRGALHSDASGPRSSSEALTNGHSRRTCEISEPLQFGVASGAASRRSHTLASLTPLVVSLTPRPPADAAAICAR